MRNGKRIIWLLANGRKKYSCKRGEPELWSDEHIQRLRSTWAIQQRGYTDDYAFFLPDLADAPKIFHPWVKFIAIVSFETQAESEPIINKYLWDE